MAKRPDDLTIVALASDIVKAGGTLPYPGNAACASASPEHVRDVLISITALNDGGTYSAELAVSIDGEVVVTGTFGGEPEDNTEYRDYAWVKGALKILAERLGATVTIERKP